MAPAHPLHDLLAGLADGTVDRRDSNDLAATLREGGHPDLPDGAVAEAIVSYADTAAVEVAEHLAPFVAGHSAVPLDPALGTAMEVRDGLELLATAPFADPLDEPMIGGMPAAGEPAPDAGAGLTDPADLDFGTGAAAGTDTGSDVAGAAGQPGPAEVGTAGPDPLEFAALPEPDPADGPGLVDLFPTGPEDPAGGDEFGDVNGG